MKYYKIIYIFLLLMILVSCENQQVIDVDAEFTEFTVVEAELRENGFFSGVKFTKTLPLGVEYSIELAEIKDITAYIRINNVQIIPIIYTRDGLYESIHEFRIQAGDTYELFAMREDNFIYSKTYIPPKAVVTQTNFNVDNNSLEADVLSSENEAYAAIWEIGSSTVYRSDDFFSVTLPESIYPGSTVSVRTPPIDQELLTPAYNGQRFIRIFSFDKSFKAYFNSRTSSGNIDDPFIQGGGSTEWNVQGSNVIGMFIGVAESVPILVN
jgi:hypothetical protein